MSGCGFRYAHYRELLAAARDSGGRRFVSFDEARGGSGPCAVLRHDVDLSVEAALTLARIEAELDVAATYFLLPHAHYNLLGEPAFAIVREIVGLGHRLGLHYDLGFYRRMGLDPGTTLRREAALLAERFGVPVSVAAGHKPGESRADFEVDPLLDAYAPEFTRGMRYLSDSCQFWREGCPCSLLRQPEPERVQLLIHPEWWTEAGEPADRILDAWAEVRRQEAGADADREFRHYASLEHLGNRHLFARRTSK